MERHLEHQSPQFAVGSQFESFSALKHACAHAALLDDFEFVPDKVDTDRYRLKCKDKECTWHLYRLEAREKPILAMFEQIRHQLMTWYTTRRSSEDKTLGLLVAKSANHLQIVTNNRARRYRSVPSIPGVLYEVKSVETRRNYIVDLVQHSCTCSIWQSSGYPCGHAISIILGQKDDPQRYVKSIFTIEAYKKTYEQPIIPLDLTNVNGDAIHSPPTVVSDEEASEPEDDSVLPPSTRRPPGRPPKRRIRGAHDEVDRPKRQFKCSRCGGIGHNRKTCREPINAPQHT